MQKLVAAVCAKCHTCQLTKRKQKKYGKVPPKKAETDPWNTLCVDLIGPYKFNQFKKEPIQMWVVTMIDPATGWFEIKDIPSKWADIVANIVKQTWLTRYPWPTKVVLDRGREFMAEFTTMLINDYGIKKKPITTRNQQANAIIERVHQTIGNILRTFHIQESQLDKDDPWGES